MNVRKTTSISIVGSRGLWGGFNVKWCLLNPENKDVSTKSTVKNLAYGQHCGTSVPTWNMLFCLICHLVENELYLNQWALSEASKNHYLFFSAYKNVARLFTLVELLEGNG